MALMGGVSSNNYTAQDSSPIPGVAGSLGFRATPNATWGDYYNYQAQQAYNSGSTLSGLMWDMQAKKSYGQPIYPVIGSGGQIGGTTTYAAGATAPAKTTPAPTLSGGILASAQIPAGSILGGTEMSPAPPILPNNTITNTSNMPVNVDYRPSATLVNNVDVPDFMNVPNKPNLLEAFPNATAQNVGETAWAPPSSNRTMSDLDGLLSGKQYPIPQPQQAPMPQMQEQKPVQAPINNQPEQAPLEPVQPYQDQMPPAAPDRQALPQPAYPIPNYGPQTIAGGVPMPEPAPQMPPNGYPQQPPQMPAYTPGQGHIDPRDYEAQRQAQLMYEAMYNPEYRDALQRQRLMQTYAYRQATQPTMAPQPIYAPGQRQPGIGGAWRGFAQNLNMLNPNVRQQNWNAYNQYNKGQNDNYQAQLANQRQWAQSATQLTDAGLNQAGQNGRAFLNSLTDLIKAGNSQNGQITQHQLNETGMKLVENYPPGPEREQAITAAATNGVDLSAYRYVPQSHKAETLQQNRELTGQQKQETLNYRQQSDPLRVQMQQAQLDRFRQSMPAYLSAKNTDARLKELKLEIEQKYGDPQAQAGLAVKQAQLQKTYFSELDTARKQANTNIMQIQNAQRNVMNAINPKDREMAMHTYEQLGGDRGLVDSMNARDEVMQQQSTLRDSLQRPQQMPQPRVPSPMDQQRSQVTQQPVRILNPQNPDDLNLAKKILADNGNDKEKARAAALRMGIKF